MYRFNKMVKIYKSKYVQEIAENRMKELLDKKAIEEYGFDTGKEEGITEEIEKENMDIILISKLTDLAEEVIKKLK